MIREQRKNLFMEDEAKEQTYTQMPTFRADQELFDLIRELISAHKQLNDPKGAKGLSVSKEIKKFL